MALASVAETGAARRRPDLDLTLDPITVADAEGIAQRLQAACLFVRHDGPQPIPLLRPPGLRFLTACSAGTQPVVDQPADGAPRNNEHETERDLPGERPSRVPTDDGCHRG